MKKRGVGGRGASQISDKEICPEEHRDEGFLFKSREALSCSGRSFRPVILFDRVM